MGAHNRRILPIVDAAAAAGGSGMHGYCADAQGGTRRVLECSGGRKRLDDRAEQGRRRDGARARVRLCCVCMCRALRWLQLWGNNSVCVFCACVCVCACVRACVRACAYRGELRVRVCVGVQFWGNADPQNKVTNEFAAPVLARSAMLL